jgi:AcrR family transcriptional regulator
MAMAARTQGPTRQKARPRLAPRDWIEASRAALVEGGIAAVRVERLATDLGVTVGSFYWHFRNRQALLVELLADWKSSNSAAMARAATATEMNAEERFDAFVQVWIREDDYSSAYDSAVRDWARTSEPVRRAIHEVDSLRVALLKGIFRDLGYDDDRAEVRARIAYFHQVGFYALDLRDDDVTRLRLRPLYTEALRDGPGRCDE